MNWELILKFINVLAWPVTVVVILYFLKSEIKGLINRIIGGKLPGGVEFNSPLNQEKPNTDIPKDILELVNTKDVSKKNNVINSETQLVKELETALFFERTYRIIFGSQMKLLEELRIRGITGAIYEDIAAYYQQTRAQWPTLNSNPLESYLGFLTQSGLIEEMSGEQQRKYKITSKGVDFLEYIEKLNYPKNKNL